MHSNRVSKTICIVVSALAVPCTMSAQNRLLQAPRHLLAPLTDEPRQIFNSGQSLYDQDNFAGAEKRFREVIQRFPRHAIADRAEYYLIRTLTQLGKTAEALARMNAFARTYPRSRWWADVEELKIRLTHQVPPSAARVLLQAPPESPVPNASLEASRRVLVISQAAAETQDLEISLQQEIMRAMFLSDATRAIEIATERLKGNMADPLVLATLDMFATSAPAQGLPMLIEIAKNSPNPKARKDAIFWMSQAKADRDSLVDALLELSSSNADDGDAINFALSQIRTEKAINALAAIAQDKSKSEATRQNARSWLRDIRKKTGKE